LGAKGLGFLVIHIPAIHYNKKSFQTLKAFLFSFLSGLEKKPFL